MTIYCYAHIAFYKIAHYCYNDDLSRIQLWLNRHKLTRNVSKSKFTLIGGSRRLKSFGSITLKIEEEEIEQVTSYKYLGLKINETLTWSDHVESICKRVTQRLGLLQRICSLNSENKRLNQL